MFARYAQNGFSRNDLENFMQMQLLGVKQTFSTFSNIHLAYATMGVLKGMYINKRLVENDFAMIVVVLNTLISCMQNV